ncbi:DinB family protein [Cohnella endophytica]|uniref:DinB family protein n=1 Tax=Cohnella endophytica TaxID=2419778 RepID=A0A494XX34_9BACL|nr:DinB family protein [Cohnella endophytica]RKP55062.1 DinB family protein [Cohnella endophytica]
MTITTVLPIWRAIQERFHKTVRNLPEADLKLQLGSASIGNMLRHNGEVEYMFANWFFGKKMPQGLAIHTGRGAAGAKTDFVDLDELITFLDASNAHLVQAMQDLPEEKWNVPIDSPMGVTTPLEAVGRLMYHTGIHVGQISLIQKNAPDRTPSNEEPAQTH